MKPQQKTPDNPYKAPKKIPEPSEYLCCIVCLEPAHPDPWELSCHSRLIHKKCFDNLFDKKNCLACSQPMKIKKTSISIQRMIKGIEILCEHCSAQMTVADLQTHHDEECLRYYIDCPLKCGALYLRKFELGHFEDVHQEDLLNLNATYRSGATWNEMRDAIFKRKEEERVAAEKLAAERAALKAVAEE